MPASKVAAAAAAGSLGSAPVIKDMRWQEPEDGVMIVRVDAATICGADVGIWKGREAVQAAACLALMAVPARSAC